ncbi:putative branched-chain-amino-acid transaminase [Medicago truncatula]|uniref:Branched-chain-amino-acid aminotransferase n=1 Tax=Medicago truncatula TaxID=3880 RepID=G7JT00_MEDTR|nr:branched-chain-amino-acid aminotransferase 2, chloroplastic [Medicago truncatula]AES90514.2 branched-chain amino acid aminotransferase [Medicago truncatula]RHN62604.1 putative branched-chain-amino-acid transaminase [Medicago truncatula]
MATSHQLPNNGKASNRETEKIYANMDWDKLTCGVIPTDYMYIIKSNEDRTYSNGTLVPFGTIDINPHSAVINYGQGLFEGMKAYRTKDGNVQLFRPEENALRMQMGAERLLMPSPSVEQYIDAVKQVVHANKRWVPPWGKGTLYIRPLLFGSGPVLGIGPAPQCTLLIFTNPISNIYKGQTSALNLLINENFPRAYPGGTGGVKSISNYPLVFQVVKEAKAKGFSDVLFLDAVEHKYIEEVSSCNAFIVKGKVLSTAPTLGTILPGVTRKSVIELARDLGYEVMERKVSVEELLEADEVFCTGTAVGISAVGSVTYKNKSVTFKTGADTVTKKLYDLITGIQTGLLEDKKGWVVKID